MNTPKTPSARTRLSPFLGLKAAVAANPELAQAIKLRQIDASRRGSSGSFRPPSASIVSMQSLVFVGS